MIVFVPACPPWASRRLRIPQSLNSPPTVWITTRQTLSRSRDIAERHCVLPLSAVMTEADLDSVVAAVLAVLAEQPTNGQAIRATPVS